MTGDSANIKSDSGLGGGGDRVTFAYLKGRRELIVERLASRIVAEIVGALAAQYLIAKETRLGEDR